MMRPLPIRALCHLLVDLFVEDALTICGEIRDRREFLAHLADYPALLITLVNLHNLRQSRGGFLEVLREFGADL